MGGMGTLLNNRLLFALVCYGLALLFVVGPWFFPEAPEVPERDMRWVGVVLWVLIASPISGALIGMGTGNLYGRRWLGAIIGFAAPIIILLALRAIWH